MTTTSNTTNSKAIVFNVVEGVVGVDFIPANSAVIIKPGVKRRVKGGIIEVDEFLAVSGVRRPNTESIILPLLALYVADAQERYGFEQSFKIVKISGKDYDSKIRAKSAYTRYLQEEFLYKTDGQGNLKNEITMDKGLKLRDTALNVRKTSPMIEAKGQVLTELLKNASKSIAKQANMKSRIIERAEELFESVAPKAEEKKETAKKESKKKASAKKETAKKVA